MGRGPHSRVDYPPHMFETDQMRIKADGTIADPFAVGLIMEYHARIARPGRTRTTPHSLALSLQLRYTPCSTETASY